MSARCSALGIAKRLAIGARDAGNETWNDSDLNHPTGGVLYTLSD